MNERRPGFRHGEQTRLFSAASRDSHVPLPTWRMAERAMLAKVLPMDNVRIWTAITEQVRVAPARLGIVRQ
jgi:hypothetical protein